MKTKTRAFAEFMVGLAIFIFFGYIASLSPAFSEEYHNEKAAAIQERNAEMKENQAKFFGPLE